MFSVRVHFSLFIFLQPNCFKPKGKLGFLDGSAGKEYGCSAGDTGDVSLIPGLGDSLEKEMAAHSTILAWEVPWTEEPVGATVRGGHRV